MTGGSRRSGALAAFLCALTALTLVPHLAQGRTASLLPQHQQHRRLAAAHHDDHARSLQQQGAQGKPCAISSNRASPFFLKAAVTCLELWPAPGAPIRVPNDTATTKYGQLVLANWDPVTATFKDRNGKDYPVSPNVRVPNDTLVYVKATPSVIVKATVDPKSGNVTAYVPEVYVPFSTIMATMANTQFEGRLYNSDPRPVGPNETSWVRWTFSNVVYVEDEHEKYGTLLMGTFDNLFRAVKDSKGVCRPALCSDPTFQSAACKYYTSHFGNATNAMTLNWDPNMHDAQDTELVPLLPTLRRQFMSANIMQLYDLLKPFQFVPRKHVFLAHGTPMGIPQNFTGTLTRATTRIQYC